MERMPNTTSLIRLNKFLSQCGAASRRGADEFIAAGRVLVNGAPAEPGLRIDPERDEVTLDGAPLRERHEQHTIMLHKPVQVMTTLRDPQGRPTVIDLLPERLRALRPVPVGRLDFFSEGLLLLTTDGELCNRLTHPRHHLPKLYEVTVRGNVPEKTLQTMRSGMRLAEGEELAPMRARVKNVQAGNALLELELIQGVNRQIRRMCRDLGLTVLRLSRVAQGPLRLGSLRPGQWRELDERELSALRKAAGLSSGEAAAETRAPLPDASPSAGNPGREAAPDAQGFGQDRDARHANGRPADRRNATPPHRKG